MPYYQRARSWDLPRQGPSYGLTSAVTCILAMLPWGLRAAAADYEPGTPATYLFDTGTSSTGLLPAAKVDPKTGWTLVPEDDLTHKFRGDAVIVNDRLAVVFRSAGTGAEVYGQTSAGPKYRVEISPRTQSGHKPTALSSLKIVENGPAAVTLAASFATVGGNSCSLKYRITAGQMIVEVRPGQGTDRLAVLAETRYLVIPDFFGHDMVFGVPDGISSAIAVACREHALVAAGCGQRRGDVRVVVEPAGGDGTSIHGRRRQIGGLRDSGCRGQAHLGRLPGGDRPVARAGGRFAGQGDADFGLETAVSGQVASRRSAGRGRNLVKLASRRCRDPRELAVRTIRHPRCWSTPWIAARPRR